MLILQAAVLSKLAVYKGVKDVSNMCSKGSAWLDLMAFPNQSGIALFDLVHNL